MNGLVALVSIFIGGVFLFVVGNLLLTAVRNLGQPVLERTATAVAKRHQARLHSAHGNLAASASSLYFVTFEFEDRSRQEFSIYGRDFGLIVEGDVGTLRSQGTWFKGFART